MQVSEATRRILSSNLFRSTERLSAFLRYIVEQWLSGNAGQLKEYSIGLAVFERGEDFDPRIDPIVRVEAGRLRLRLKRYYETEGLNDPIRIELPKGGYTPSTSILPDVAVSAPPSEPVSDTQAPHIGILLASFTDLSPSQDHAYLCHGLREELISSLTKIPVLRVYAQNSSSSRIPSEAPLETGARLGAQFVLTGSVRQFDSRIRVSAQLVRLTDGSYIWSETFEREAVDLLSLQVEIAQAIVAAMEVKLDGYPLQQARRHSVESTAYNLYLKGRYFWNLRTEHSLWKGVDFFQQCVAINDRYALAYAGLADSYTLLANYGATPPNEVRGRAKEAALRAVALDPDLAEARNSLAHVLATYEWDWQAAEREYETSILLNPSYATSHHWYAITLLGPLGRLEEAIFEMERARQLDPISLSINRDLAILQLFRRRYDLALEQSERTIALDSCFPGGFWVRGLVCQQVGDHEQAVRSFQQALELASHFPRFLGALGHGYALQGQSHEARRILTRLEELRLERYVNPFESALIHVGLGNLDDAFTSLEQVCTIRSYELVSLQMDPRFDSLREDQRYKRLLTTIGLRHFAEQ
jgi:TolB-like protein/Flp pilus assembly protein TadD